MRLLLHAFTACLFLTSCQTSADPGEFNMLPIFPMSKSQITNLHKNFSKSANEVEQIKKETLAKAEAHINHKPSPLKKIYYEGKLNTDPKRQQAIKSLNDMVILSHLSYAAIIDDPQNSKYLPKIKEIILAWARTYIPTGNPINENKLEPLFCSYYMFKGHFSAAEQKDVENFVTKLAEKERARKVSKTNWFTKKIKLLLYAGIILENKSQIDWCVKEFKDYIAHSLRKSGSSIEIEHRDAMSYHVAGLKPLLQIAIILQNSGFKEDLYGYLSSADSSLKKSSHFVLPYAKGEKVYEQWRNTKVKLDKQRAAAGIAKYQPGYKWKPESGTEFYIMASYFDSSFSDLTKKYTVERNDKLLKFVLSSLN